MFFKAADDLRVKLLKERHRQVQPVFAALGGSLRSMAVQISTPITLILLLRIF
jgi:hypothetical protein